MWQVITNVSEENAASSFRTEVLVASNFRRNTASIITPGQIFKISNFAATSLVLIK
jgi:hypothetical protein